MEGHRRDHHLMEAHLGGVEGVRVGAGSELDRGWDILGGEVAGFRLVAYIANQGVLGDVDHGTAGQRYRGDPLAVDKGTIVAVAVLQQIAARIVDVNLIDIPAPDIDDILIRLQGMDLFVVEKHGYSQHGG